jgi:hypothetical protein
VHQDIGNQPCLVTEVQIQPHGVVDDHRQEPIRGS